MLVWVSGCTKEVQTFRLIAAINTVFLRQKPGILTSASSGQLAARDITLKSKGDLEQEPQLLKKRIWSIVPCSRDVPDDVDLVFSSS